MRKRKEGKDLKDSDKSVAEQLVDLFIEAKKFAIDHKDYLFYKDFLDDSRKTWSLSYLEAKTEAGKALYTSILKTVSDELKWVEKKIAESKVPF